MIRCSGCKRKFNDAENYGICPRCGSYNAKDINVIKEKNQEAAGTKGVVLGLFLSLGIVISLAGIVIQVFRMAGGRSNIIETDIKGQEERLDYTKEQPFQSFLVSKDQMIITVEDAKVVENESSGLPGYPQDEKLVAIPLEFSKCEEFDPDDSEALKEPYVRYLSGDGQYIYKNSIFPDTLEAYDVDYGSLLSYYDFSFRDAGAGSFLFFIDPEAAELEFYLPEQDRKEELRAIYKLNLSVLEKEDKRWER